LKKIIIAVDGHSSCGKSTLAKQLAQALDYTYIDSGAMYRAVTFFLLQHQTDLDNEVVIKAALDKITVQFKSTPDGNCTFLNGINIESEIRKMTVSDHVSKVAAISLVRKEMVRQQRIMGIDRGVVMDGRDIGTVVFKDAELKIFLTAAMDVRAQRRYDELINKNIEVSLEAVKANLTKRDHIDSTREDSPLKQAADAILIDNTNLTPENQLKLAMRLAMRSLRQNNMVE